MKSVYDSLHLRYRQHRSSYLHGLQTSLLLWALSIVLFLAPLTVRAQFVADTLNILFPLDSIRIDMDFGDNEARWTAFEQRFRARYAHLPAASLRLDIYSGASPEGVPKHNEWLGEHRGQAVRRLVRSRLGDHIGDIVVHNEGARWEGLYDLIAHSDEPWRDEVLRIIEMPPSRTLEGRDQREFILRRLYRGRLWQKLQKYLAPLRSGASAVLSWQHGGRDTLVIRDTVWVMQQGDNAPRQRDTIWVISRDTIVQAFAAGDFAAGGLSAGAAASHANRSSETPKPVVRRPAWILRTNLPLLGTLSPNLQAEWSLDHRDRWSFNVEFIGPWFIFGHNAYANELVYGSAELRYWLGRRRRHHSLDGFHVGLSVGGGYYDFEWKSRGYQGEIAMAFVNVGWQRRFGKRHQWAFDVGVGFGYLYSPYRRYLGSTLFPESHTEQYDDHLMWQETNRLHWPGTPHANISIGYVFTPRKGLYRRTKAVERDSIRTAIERQRDAIEELQRQQRDSLYLRWYDLPRKERKAAQKAYFRRLKEQNRKPSKK